VIKLIRVSTTIFFCLAQISCVSNTTLVSSDPDAEIVVDNQKQRGMLYYGDRKPFWGSTDISIQKKDCETKYYKLDKADDASLWMLAAAPITYGVSLLWIADYRPQYTFAFTCNKNTESK
jgi:hypothetical protein